MALEESSLEEDEVVEAHDLKFLVHNKDMPYFNGRTVDYVKNVLGMGQFKVI